MSKIPKVSGVPDFDTVFIDSDIARYQLGSLTCPHPFNKHIQLPAAPKFIHRKVDEWYANIMEATGAEKSEMFLTGPGNFRFNVATLQPYKGTRTSPKPYHWQTVSDYLHEKFNPHVVLGTEADDLLGIYQKEALQRGVLTVIASRDKDMLTCPGWHYKWRCGTNQPEKLMYQSPIESERFFFKQMLIGDTIDHIPGCGYKRKTMWGGTGMMRRHGVGAKTADKLLSDCTTIQEMYDIVKLQYIEFFQPWEVEVYMLENARLLFIGQTEDNIFDWDWKGVKV